MLSHINHHARHEAAAQQRSTNSRHERIRRTVLQIKQLCRRQSLKLVLDTSPVLLRSGSHAVHCAQQSIALCALFVEELEAGLVSAQSGTIRANLRRGVRACGGSVLGCLKKRHRRLRNTHNSPGCDEAPSIQPVRMFVRCMVALNVVRLESMAFRP
jgi:hypothetical protein